MNTRYFVIALLASLLSSCGATEVSPPTRVPGVPESATWAGGADGGQWFLCSPRSESLTRFDCSIYNDFTGTVTAEGQFELRQGDVTLGLQSLAVPVVVPNALEFRSFDGGTIELVEPYVLLADGELHYPFGRGWGKRQKFRLGEELGPAVEYGGPAA